MKQHVHGDLEPLVTSCREVPWKLGRQTHCCDGAFQRFARMKANPSGSPNDSSPLATAQKLLGARGPPSPEGGCPGPAAAPLPAPHRCPQPGPGSGCAFPSSSSGLREINRSSGACSQPSFPCDPSELRLRQRALFPGPAEGMFYS